MACDLSGAAEEQFRSQGEDERRGDGQHQVHPQGTLRPLPLLWRQSFAAPEEQEAEGAGEERQEQHPIEQGQLSIPTERR